VTSTIVVGTDGSAVAQVAVRWAAQFACATRAELVVVTAWQPPFAEIDPATASERLDDAQRVLEDQWCAPARQIGVDLRPIVEEGDPRQVILACAEEQDADLVVVGARGASHHKHPLHFGSVTHHVIHHTDRALATIPPHVSTAAPTRLVVGLDGSDSSTLALTWCIDYARDRSVEVVAVHSELPLAEWVPHSDPHSWFQAAQEDLNTWAAPLREAAVTSRELVVEHEPATGLAETAIREGADLLVVGARGRGGFTGLRLGSTAMKVLHQSDLPVVLLPTPTS
jgi:nucleotide-binding universal stress UspA family protein